MKKRMMSLLWELIKDCKRSDRELAKVLGFSQPTTSRMRNELVKDGMVTQFTVIPDLPRMGYEVAAFTFLKVRLGPEIDRPEMRIKGREWAMKQPNMVYATGCEGMGMNGLIVSVHKDYSDYYQFVIDLRGAWGPEMLDIQSFLVSLKNREVVTKPFSLRYLEGLQKGT
jgi:DNA-binding Lrp family transcriptional regulator